AAPTPTTPTPPPATGGSCDTCVAKARAGDIAGAAQGYASCSDGPQKKECLKRIKALAPNAATAAARNGQCDRARAIIAAAQQIGASTPSLGRALDNTSCKSSARSASPLEAGARLPAAAPCTRLEGVVEAVRPHREQSPKTA